MFRISRDPILSKSFKEMSEAEFELAKLEASKIVNEIVGNNAFSKDFKQSVVLSLLNEVGSGVEDVRQLDETFSPVELPEDRDPFKEEESLFTEVSIPDEPEAPVTYGRSIQARKKEQSGASGSDSFTALAKALRGRSRS